MVKSFRSRGWHKEEPCRECPQEEPQLFEQMVFHALAEDLISESKAAELLAMPLTDFHALRNMERADDGSRSVSPPESPIDVPGVDMGASTQEIVEVVRAGRARYW